MHDSTVRFGYWFRCMATVVMAAGWSVVATAQDAVPAHVAPIRAGGDALEATLMAKTALAVDQLPRKVAVQKLAELQGIRIRLNEDALAEAGVRGVEA